jgi:hypothetical protein
MFTTNLVVVELHALVLARRGREMASNILSVLDRAPATTIVRVAEDDEREARTIIRRYADRDFSLTDALSFAVMRRLRISAGSAARDARHRCRPRLALPAQPKPDRVV